MKGPMESWPPGRWAPPGPLSAPWLLGLFLLPWTLKLTGTPSSFFPRALWPRTSEPLSSSGRLIPGPVSGDLLVAFEHCRLHRRRLQGPGDV